MGKLFVLGTLLTFLGAQPLARAQSVKQIDSDHISIDARGRSLGDLIQELKAVVEFDIVLLSPDVRQKLLDVRLENIPVLEGITKVLDAARVDYVVWGGDGAPLRIFAGTPGDTEIPAAPSPSMTPQPEPPLEEEELPTDMEGEITEPDAGSETPPGSPISPDSSSPSGSHPTPGWIPTAPPTSPTPVPPTSDEPDAGPFDEPTMPPPAQGGPSPRATDEAVLSEPPTATRVTLVLSVLLFGFAIGGALLNHPAKK